MSGTPVAASKLTRSFLEWLRKERAASELGPTIIAARLGISRSNFYLWEKGLVLPRTLDDILRWARILGISLRVQYKRKNSSDWTTIIEVDKFLEQAEK